MVIELPGIIALARPQETVVILLERKHPVTVTLLPISSIVTGTPKMSTLQGVRVDLLPPEERVPKSVENR